MTDDNLNRKDFVMRILVIHFFILFLAISASAHPGRTDADGCHTDSATGIRHCDHGEADTSTAPDIPPPPPLPPIELKGVKKAVYLLEMDENGNWHTTYFGQVVQ